MGARPCGVVSVGGSAGRAGCRGRRLLVSFSQFEQAQTTPRLLTFRIPTSHWNPRLPLNEHRVAYYF